MAKKEHLNVVFIGHVDAGKSTTVGRILYDTGRVSEQAIKKLKEEADKLGKATFEFAFVMDSLKEERERGVTIEISHQDFETPKYYFTVIDAPGHRDFIKNMISGASQADAAVLLISTKDGIQPQTKEHAFLAKVLGINQFIVLLSKMDAVSFSQDSYNKMKAEVSTLLKGIGYNPDKIAFIPTSAYFGDNLKNKSTNMPWYTGKTLFEQLDELTVPSKPTDKPLRVPIQDVYVITGHGCVPVGKVDSGIMKLNQKLVVMPSNKVGEVKKIEMHHQEISEAGPGDNIGFNLKGVEKGDIKRGDVAGPVDNPPTVADEFTAQVVVLNHPTAMPVGYTPVFHIHETHFPGKILEITKGGQKADFIKTGESAVVRVKALKPVVIEKYSEFPTLGRFAIRDMNMTVAAGVVLDVKKKA
jgi:elongation factor 1-alpha